MAEESLVRLSSIFEQYLGKLEEELTSCQIAEVTFSIPFPD